MSLCTSGSVALYHGLGSRVHTRTPEADLVAPPEGNRRHQGAQWNKGTRTHNTTDKPLHSALKMPLAGGCRRGMQLQCSVVWNCSSLTLALPRAVKVTLAFLVHHRDGETMVIHRLYHAVDMGFAMSLPRGGYRLLSPAREYGGECSCEAGSRSNNEGALRE